VPAEKKNSLLPQPTDDRPNNDLAMNDDDAGLCRCIAVNPYQAAAADILTTMDGFSLTH